MTARLPAGAAALLLAATVLSAQRVEVAPIVGGKWNGSVDYTTRNYSGADFGSALTYGGAVGVYLSWNVEAEFQYSRSGTHLASTPQGGGPAVNVFDVNMDQYFGNLLFHFCGQEDRMRPYLIFGVGATHFSPQAPGTSGLTRPAFGLGGGLKYVLRKNADLRVQWRWLPINMYTSQSGTWCGPATGCWSIGTGHYLHSLEYSTGVGFRF